MVRNSVVFPQPLGPTIPSMSPRATSKDRSSNNARRCPIDNFSTLSSHSRTSCRRASQMPSLRRVFDQKLRSDRRPTAGNPALELQQYGQLAE